MSLQGPNPDQTPSSREPMKIETLLRPEIRALATDESVSTRFGYYKAVAERSDLEEALAHFRQGNELDDELARLSVRDVGKRLSALYTTALLAETDESLKGELYKGAATLIRSACKIDNTRRTGGVSVSEPLLPLSSIITYSAQADGAEVQLEAAKAIVATGVLETAHPLIGRALRSEGEENRLLLEFGDQFFAATFELGRKKRLIDEAAERNRRDPMFDILRVPKFREDSVRQLMEFVNVADSDELRITAATSLSQQLSMSGVLAFQEPVRLGIVNTAAAMLADPDYRIRAKGASILTRNPAYAVESAALLETQMDQELEGQKQVGLATLPDLYRHLGRPTQQHLFQKFNGISNSSGSTKERRAALVGIGKMGVTHPRGAMVLTNALSDKDVRDVALNSIETFGRLADDRMKLRMRALLSQVINKEKDKQFKNEMRRVLIGLGEHYGV